MRYLFFDIEGANCFDFVSKMCTFGYVITTSEYKIKSKIDVVMNPESVFERHIVKEKMNAYPISLYSNRPPFPYFYKSISSILSHEDQLVVGWSIENDVKYIYDACKRYNLNQIKYSYIDMQKVYMKIHNLKVQPSLESACEKYDIKVKTAHKSDDDAFLTMLLTKKLCKLEELTLDLLFKKYSDCVSSVEEFSLHALSDEEIKVRINRRKIYNLIRSCKRKHFFKDKLINEDDIYGFDISVIDEKTDKVKEMIHYIIDCGAKCSNNLSICNKIIYDKKMIKKSKAENIIFINYKNFKIMNKQTN